MQPLGAQNRIALLGLSVGLVLADSSVVTLALPKILVQFDVEVSTLAWALISFNLALALAAVPAAALARRRPVAVFGVSTVIFAASSLACAFSPTFGVLVGLRAVQGVAGAAGVADRHGDLPVQQLPPGGELVEERHVRQGGPLQRRVR